MAQYEYMLGTSYGGLVNLESMTVPVFAPKHSPIVYSKPVNLGDASVRGLGWLTTSWHWDFLSQAQYTQLKGLCSDLSAQVYIKTKNNAGSYSYYTCTMLWPTKEPEREAGRILDMTITFRNMVVYTPPS